jgi:transcriptional regulator with XRE-family HTH domain
MERKPPGYNPDQLRYMKNFAIGKLNTEEFLKRRKKKFGKWPEMIDLIKEPYFFSLFLNRLPRELRPKALRDAHDLTNEYLKNMINDTGQIDKILKGNFSVDGSISFLYQMAIIFDTPIDYLILENPLYQNADPNKFTEYNKINNEKKLSKVINNLILRPNQRYIEGYLIPEENSLLKRNTVVRIDKRVEFFSFEIFLPSLSYVNDIFLQHIHQLLYKHIKYILLSQGLMRDIPKISLIGLYDDNTIHASYLESTITELKARTNAQIIYPV